MTEILSNVFRTVISTAPSDLLSVVYLSANRVAPAHEGVELGIGDGAITKSLAETFGKKDEHIKSQLKVPALPTHWFFFSMEQASGIVDCVSASTSLSSGDELPCPQSLGDLGLVAKANRSAQRLMSKPVSLTCVKVLEIFRVIAKASSL